ncbi:MAG TPA: VanZ family protein [Fimbriimonadaceae bacterium]|nr:VanZ family protein [Fimbriimonadaceae bacterium]
MLGILCGAVTLLLLWPRELRRAGLFVGAMFSAGAALVEWSDRVWIIPVLALVCGLALHGLRLPHLGRLTLLLLMGWLVVHFSGSSGSPQPMSRFFLDWIGLTAAQAEFLVITIRKIIHFTFYGLLAWNAYRIGRASPRGSAVGFALAMALIFALYDESHQLLATDRSGSPWDVGLDMFGATTFLGVSVLRYGRREGTQESSDLEPSR